MEEEASILVFGGNGGFCLTANFECTVFLSLQERWALVGKTEFLNVF